MNTVQLPPQINGSWIWLNSLKDKSDTCLLFRKTFVCEEPTLETTLWISARNYYQVFINGTFVAFGPRGHYISGINYIDQHEINFAFEQGINTIIVVVYNNCSKKDNSTKNIYPGFWCQLSNEHEQFLKSDNSWDVLELNENTTPRPRVTPCGPFTQIARADLFPIASFTSEYTIDDSWQKPDLILPIGSEFAQLELHPLLPPAVGFEEITPEPEKKCKVTLFPAWTEVAFTNCVEYGKTYAAAAYVYREEKEDIKVCIYTDNEYKFFCNTQLIAQGASSNGLEPLTITLHNGWNRLLVIKKPELNSSGMLLVFPELTQEEIFISYDTVDIANEGWLTTGPLRLDLAHATASLRFENLANKQIYHTTLDKMFNYHHLLKFASLEDNLPSYNDDYFTLTEGEHVIFSLSCVQYGFLALEIAGNEGDILEINIGTSITDNSTLCSYNYALNTASLYCTSNNSSYFLSKTPDKCCFISLTARKCAKTIQIKELLFKDLVLPKYNEASFSCSNPKLNAIWDTGFNILKNIRTTVPLVDSGSSFNMYMLDSYIESLNSAIVFGDSTGITARFRQFTNAQLENGQIPALSFDNTHISQIHHLFFYPSWLNHNYRFTTNRVELERALPTLDLLLEFFETLLDNETGLLPNSSIVQNINSRIGSNKIHDTGFSTSINALFCRFLLSAVETYRMTDQLGKAKYCLKLTTNIASQIRLHLRNENTKLFKASTNASDENNFDFFSNFCAIYGGIFKLEYFDDFFHSFFNYDAPFDKTSESQTPYLNFLLLEMLFSLNQKEWALEYLEEYWYKRINPRLLAWKSSEDEMLISPIQRSNGSTVTPNIFLIQEVLGIRIGENVPPTVFFEPAYKSMNHAEGIVPIFGGKLKVKWAVTPENNLDVTFESTVKLKIMPELSKKVLLKTSFSFNDNVTILAPPDDNPLLDNEDDDIVYKQD